MTTHKIPAVVMRVINSRIPIARRHLESLREDRLVIKGQLDALDQQIKDTFEDLTALTEWMEANPQLKEIVK